MTDSLLNDVTSLLEGDFGDDRILKQIARACKNNEVISNYERNYVQKLAEQYVMEEVQQANLQEQNLLQKNLDLNFYHQDCFIVTQVI